MFMARSYLITALDCGLDCWTDGLDYCLTVIVNLY